MSSLTRQIGQSLMLRFMGPHFTPMVGEAIARLRPSGVILFADNITTPTQLHELCRALQACAAECELPPLLIGIDQEGGIVSRLPTPWVVPPSQMAQAATGDPASARTCAEITGQQLRAAGINVNFAPVLDVNCNSANPVIGTRSFGADAETVARFGLAALEGYREAGVVAVAKHFPGHGDTTVDSHLGLPMVPHGRARLDTVELAPFRAAIAAGVPGIMTAHIQFSALDAAPATLSHAILTDLLRDELGYNGVIFTDALDMRAIADTYGKAEAAVLAKAAGADVLLPLGELDEQIAVAGALHEALEAGRLAPEQFSTTAERLDRLRAEFAIDGTEQPDVAPDAALEHAALEIVARGIAVRNPRAILPLDASTSLLLIDCLLPRFSRVEEATERAELLRTKVRAVFPQTRCFALQPEWDDQTETLVLQAAQQAAAVLLVTRNAGFIEQQARLAHRLASLGVPLLHAAVRNPDADMITPDAVTLNTYGDPPLSLHALIERIGGRRQS